MTTSSLRYPVAGHATARHPMSGHPRRARAALTRLACLFTLLLTASGVRLRRDDGMSTAEYAVGTVAAVAFAAVLYKVVRSGAVQTALTGIIQGALGITL